MDPEAHSDMFVRQSLIASALTFRQERECLGEGGVGRTLGSAFPLQGMWHLVHHRDQSRRISDYANLSPGVVTELRLKIRRTDVEFFEAVFSFLNIFLLLII